MPPVIPAPKFAPIRPRITATPPVMYSHPFDPQPSTTTEAPVQVSGGFDEHGGYVTASGSF